MSDTKQSARDLCAEVRHLDQWATKKWVADPRSDLYILHDGGKKGPNIRVDGAGERNLILCYRTAAPALRVRADNRPLAGSAVAPDNEPATTHRRCQAPQGGTAPEVCPHGGQWRLSP